MADNPAAAKATPGNTVFFGTQLSAVPAFLGTANGWFGGYLDGAVGYVVTWGGPEGFAIGLYNTNTTAATIPAFPGLALTLEFGYAGAQANSVGSWSNTTGVN